MVGSRYPLRCLLAGIAMACVSTTYPAHALKLNANGHVWCDNSSGGLNNGAGITCTGTPNFTNQGPWGTSYQQHPEIVLIFWQDALSGSGAEWTNNTNTPTMGSVIAETASVVNSAFYGVLGQYASVPSGG